MKFQPVVVTLLALTATMAPIITAKPADTCLAQSDCMKVTIEPESSNPCDDECSFKVCFIRDNQGSCQKSNSDTFSHWCEKDDEECAVNDGFGDAEEKKGLPYGYEQCQIVGPESEVEFLIKDGSGCDDEDEYAITATVDGVEGEYTGVCEPRPADIESCTGNGVGKECVWTFTTPACPDPDPDPAPPEPTTTDAPPDTTNAPPDTTDAPPDTTDAPPDTTDAPPDTTDAPPDTTDAPPDTTDAPPDTTDAPPDTTDAPPDTTDAPPDTTDAPPDTTDAPPDTTPNPNTKGDPHFTMWGGHKFDFHGACDMVFLHNPGFNHGQGMRIHMRTKKLRWWSYVESAVLQIGNDTLEIMGGDQESRYWVNGVLGPQNIDSGMQPYTIGGFGVRYRVLSDHKFQYKVFLNNGQTIILRSVKDFLHVELTGHNSEDFSTSQGILGSYEDGLMLARDGITVLDDPNEFGMEWQVRHDEPMLFHNVEGPQHPVQCTMPSHAEPERRRLGEQTVSRHAAEVACKKADKDSKRDCVFDVMATNDVEMADSY